MHMHAIAVEISISKVEARVDKENGKKIAIGFLKTGEKGVVQIKVKKCIFRLFNQFASKNTNLCTAWVASFYVTKESKYYFI